MLGWAPLPRSVYRWTWCGHLLDEAHQAAAGTDRAENVTCERCLQRLANPSEHGRPATGDQG